MDFETLCAGIQLQEEIRVEAIRYYRSEEFQKMRPLAEGLKSMETEAEARKRLRQLSGLLPEKSNIRDFQERFEIVRMKPARTMRNGCFRQKAAILRIIQSVHHCRKR